MFQPLLDLIERFVGAIDRIADALELLAKSNYYKEDIAIKEKEIREKQKAEEEAKRKSILEELVALKISYSAEMSTDQLERRLKEKREKAIEDIKAAEDKTPAKEPEPKEEKPKAKTRSKSKSKKKAEPKATTKAEPETKGMTDEELKEECVKLCQAKGDAWLVEFFKKYEFENPVTKISQIDQSERAAFIDKAKSASKAGD